MHRSSSCKQNNWRFLQIRKFIVCTSLLSISILQNLIAMIFIKLQNKLCICFKIKVLSNKNKLDYDFISFSSQTHSYSIVQSNFSRSESYQNFFYYPSTIFGTLLPFILLSVLNGFLIWTVRKSHKMRHAMTNTRQVTI